MKHSLRIQTQLQNEFGFIVVYITERKIPKTILSVFSSNCTFLKSTKCLKDSSLYFFLILASIKKYPENDPTKYIFDSFVILTSSKWSQSLAKTKVV